MKFALRAGLAVLLCVMFVPYLSAEGPEAGPGNYVITEVTYHIDGITREGALMKELDNLQAGLVFKDEAALKAFIADRKQLLINLRQLKESSRIEYAAKPQADGSYAVTVDIYTEDTWNIIVFPIPEYDSNNGLSVTIKYRDKNFFGTLERFALDLAWGKKDGNTKYDIAGSFTLPFNLIEHQWYWKTGVDWQYLDGENDLETSTSLGIDLPMGAFTPTLTVKEAYNYDTSDIDTQWLTTKLDLAETFATGLVLPGFGEFEYTPSIFTQVDYKFDEPISAGKEGLEVGFAQSLEAGRVDWIGNFRKGVEFSASNTNTFNLQHQYWDREVLSHLSGYYPLPFKILWWPFQVSGRVSGLAELDTPEDEAASYIRGIRDTKMGTAVEYGGFLNTDLTMSAFTIPKFVEGQGSVYFDAGVVKEKNIEFDPDKHFKMGVGLEAIGFPLFARSYYMRASLGFDLKEVLDEGTWKGDNYELFIVLGHHY